MQNQLISSCMFPFGSMSSRRARHVNDIFCGAGPANVTYAGAVPDVSHGITEQSGHVQVGISCWLMHICFPNFELIFLSNGAFDFDSV